jgi:hypothetical protein
MARRDIARRSERWGRCIRHAFLRAASPVLPLPVAVIESALGATLMTTVSAPPLFANRWDTTLRTAIPLTAITGTTEGEDRVASAAYALP